MDSGWQIRLLYKQSAFIIKLSQERIEWSERAAKKDYTQNKRKRTPRPQMSINYLICTLPVCLSQAHFRLPAWRDLYIWMRGVN